MQKKVFLAILLVASLLLSGCALITVDEKADNARIIIDVNGETVTKAEVKNAIDYQIQQKVFSAKNMLANTNLSVKEIASSLGYEDQHYFSYMFKKRCGKSPTQYRKIIRSEYGEHSE